MSQHLFQMTPICSAQNVRNVALVDREIVSDDFLAQAGDTATTVRQPFS